MASPLTTVPFNAAYSAQTPYANGATAMAGPALNGYPSNALPFSGSAAPVPAGGQSGLTNNKGLNIIINQPYVTADDTQGTMRPPAPFPAAYGAYPNTGMAAGAPGSQGSPLAQSFPMANPMPSGDAFGLATPAQTQPINPALPPTDQLTVAYSNANALSNQAVNALAAAETARRNYLTLGQQLNTQAAPQFSQPALPPAFSQPALPPQAASPFQPVSAPAVSQPTASNAPGMNGSQAFVPPAPPMQTMQDPFLAAANSQNPSSAIGAFQPPSNLTSNPTPTAFPVPVPAPIPGSPSPSQTPGQPPTAETGMPGSPTMPPSSMPSSPMPSSSAPTPGQESLAGQPSNNPPTGNFPDPALSMQPPVTGTPSTPGNTPGTLPGMPPSPTGAMMPPMPGSLPGGTPSPSPTPMMPGQSPLSGAPAPVLNELLLASNPQNNEYEQLKQAAKKNKGQAAPDTLIRSGRLQQQDEAIQEIALQAQQPGHPPLPPETFDRLELLANIDTKNLKGQSKEELDTLRTEALWTLGLLNASQNSNTPTSSLPGLKTMQRIVMDSKESPALRRAAAQGTQASVANRSGNQETQQFLKQTKSNGKSAFKPWTLLRQDLPKDVKDVIEQTSKGVQIAAPPQSVPSAEGMANGQMPGQAMPGQFPGQLPNGQVAGIPGPTMSGAGMDPMGMNSMPPGMMDPSMIQNPSVNAGMPGLPGAGNVIPFQQGEPQAA